jgi:RHS repeat-associated protein
VTAAPRGSTGLTIRITGSPNAQFVSGARAAFGSGVTVNSTTVESATSLVANITVAASAALGPRAVGVISPTQTAILAGAFAIIAGNRAPALAPIEDSGVPEGGVLDVAISASDPDGDVVTITSDALPAFAQLTDHGNRTATLHITPGYADAGAYPVTLSASDGTLSSSQGFILTVTDFNRPPAVSSQPVSGGRDGRTYQYLIIATDPDNDPLAFSLAAAPTGMTVDLTGAVAWVPTGDQVGRHAVTVVVSDGRGGTVNHAFEVDVVDLIQPAVALVAPAEALPGSQVRLLAYAQDNARVSSVTFEVAGGPPVETTAQPFEHAFTVPAVAAVGSTISVRATARDPSGNASSDEALVTIAAQPDTSNPTIALNLPLQAAPGSILRITAAASDLVGISAVTFLVGGVAIETDRAPPYEATYLVPSGLPAGGSLTILARAEDFAGNVGEAGGSVLLVSEADTTPPTVALAVDATVVEGAALALHATAGDEGGVASVVFLVDGVPLATDLAAPYDAVLALPAGSTPGNRLQIQVRAIDFAGLEASDVAEVLVVAAPIPGRGVIAGAVYDDATGLPVADAVVQLVSLDGSPIDPPQAQGLTDSLGRFRLASATGLARLRITKLDFTAAERTVPVVDGRRTDPFDARLTPLDGRETIVSSVLGALVSNLAGDVTLTVSAGSLAENRAVRLTTVGPQGLIGRLPLGWSVVRALDIQPADLSLQTPASASIQLAAGMPSGAALLVARWDGEQRAWIAAGAGSLSADGRTATVSLSRGGQYVLLLADTAPAGPALPAVGEGLPGVLAQPPPDGATAAITPSPRILFAQPEAHSRVGVLVAPPARLPSGTPLALDVRESVSYLDGNRLQLEPGVRDFSLQSFGASGGPLGLASSFTVTPSRLVESFRLRQGVIDLAARLAGDRGAARGVVVAPAGGTAEGADGARLIVPAGGANEDLPVLLSLIPGQDVSSLVPPGLVLVAGVGVDFHGGSLSQAAALALPTPSTLPTTGEVLLARIVEFDGVSRLGLVGLGVIQSGELVFGPDPRGDGSLVLPGIREGGSYLLLASSAPLTFVNGTVSGPDGQPLGGALVSVDSFGVAALSDGQGRYVLAAPVGDARVAAVDPTTNDSTSVLVSATTAGSVAPADLSTAPTPPRVLAIVPANGTPGVSLTSAVAVTFSEPLDPAGVGSNAVALTAGSTSVSGLLSLAPGGTSVTFRPNTLLESHTTYQVRISGTVRDLTGHAMGTDAISSFTTVDVTPPPPPPAGNISATIPSGGTTTVQGTQGTADPGGLVIVQNLTTGSQTTVTPGPDGSFSAAVAAATSDQLELLIRDGAGNETRVAIGRFQNADGSTVIGEDGGTVLGPGGVAVEIPPGALPDGTVVRVEPVAVGDLPLPPPPAFSYAGAVRLDLGGVTPRAALDLSVQAPADAAVGDQVLVLEAVQLQRRLVWSLADRAHLEPAPRRYTTASPPFPGVLEPSTYAFVRYDGSCASYVAITTQFNFQTLQIPTSFGLTIPVTAVADPEVSTVVFPAVCDAEFEIQVLDPNTEQVIQQITQHAPAIANEIYFSPDVLSDDQTPPVVVWSNTVTGFKVDRVEMVFSEPMQVQSVCQSFALRDSHNNTVAGRIVGCEQGALQQGNTLLVFVPDLPLRLGEQYTFSLAGATDRAGNPIQLDAGSLIFRTFAPQVVTELGVLPDFLAAFTKCSAATSACATSVTDAETIGDVLFVANGLRSSDDVYINPGDPPRLLAFDVSDPYHPALIGIHATLTNPRALAAVPKASFTLPNGNLFAGDILVVAGGGRVQGGELASKIEVYDVTPCTRHLAVDNCLDGALKGHKLLSTPAGVPPKPGVPAASGVALQVATLASRDASGTAISAGAYATVTSVGLEAVNIADAFNFPLTPDTPLGPDGLVLGDFLDVAVLQNSVVAIGVPGQFAGEAGFRLLVYPSNLIGPVTITDSLLPGAIARVGTAANLVFDVDHDGNLGQAEVDDNGTGSGSPDPLYAQQELFDLAAVTSGSLSEGCPANVVPCGKLYLLDLSSLTDLRTWHAIPAHYVASQITLPGPTFGVQIDPEQKLAYVEVRGRGLAIIDLGHLDAVFSLQGAVEPPAFLDEDGDGTDDRVLAIVPLADVIMTDVRVDLARGLAYVNGASTGIKIVCVREDECLPKRVEIARGVVGTTAFTTSRTSLDILITPEQWAANTTLCLELTLRLPAGDTITYSIGEFPLLSDQLMLDLSGGSIGTLDASASQLCMTTNSTKPFPLESFVRIEFADQTGVLNRTLMRLIPAMVRAQDVKLRTEVDRINGDACSSGAALQFELFYPATVTLSIDGEDVLQNVRYPAGRHAIPVTAEMVSLPGEHPFEIAAVFRDDGPPVSSSATGRIVHEIVINASLPLGHTMIKGVDLADGHLTHATQEVAISGRGFSLDFTRTYSSAGGANAGPLGAGWTHSYNVKLVRGACGKYIVFGGEGSGNAFTRVGDTFRPQIGYHSTLVKVSQTEFDFFTKARVQYRFVREPALFGEVYTLRFIQDPNGNRTTLDYLAGDNDPVTLDTVTDASGRALVLEYVDSVTGPDGFTVFFGDKRISAVRGRSRSADPQTNLLGLEIRYEYDIHGNLVRATRVSANPAAQFNDERLERYGYTDADPNDRHNLVSYTDPSGNVTTYTYMTPDQPLSGLAETFANVTNFQSYLGLQTSDETAAFFGAWKKELIASVNQTESAVTRFTYDFQNGTRQVSDPRAPVEPIPPTTYTLNSYGATVQIAAPLGKVATMTWCTDAPHPACPNASGEPGVDVLMVSKIDPEGRTHRYEYDAAGNLLRETVEFTGGEAPVTLADGVTPVVEITTAQTYEPIFNKITSQTDAEGNLKTLLIDAEYSGKPSFCPDATPGGTGNLLGLRDAEGNATCFAYEANGDLSSVTDPRGFVAAYHYDGFGNRSQITDPLNNVTTQVFDERSRLVETSDTFTHHARFVYDGLDRKISEERLDDLGEFGSSQGTVSRYRPTGELLTMTDGFGQVTRFEYDGLNRTVRKTEEGILQPDGTVVNLVWIYAYDPTGNLTEETDPREITLVHSYDALNRRLQTVVQGPATPDGVTTWAATYDLVDNTVTESDLHGHVTTVVYDGLYRVVETQLPFPNAVIRSAYDRMGNKVRETDANGQPVTLTYDHVFRLTQKTDADGNSSRFVYDAAGNRTREQNLSSGLVAEYLEHDGLNRPGRIRQTVPLGGLGLTTAVYETRYAYEDDDNAVVVTNPRGFRSRTDKDGLNRVVQTLVDFEGLNLTTTLTYDANGNVRTIRDPDGGNIDVTHEYDGLNRKIRSTYVDTPSDQGQLATEEFVYDGNDNLVRHRDKRGIVFVTTYDNLDRPLRRTVQETITNGGADLTLMAYSYDDAQSSVAQTDANGNTTVTYGDGLHRPRIVDDPDPNDSFDPTGPGPFPRGLLVYEYDAVNKRAEINKEGHRTEYVYDAVNRLVESREFDETGTVQTTLGVDYLDAQNQKRETDRLGIVTTSQLDGLGRLVQLKRSGLDMADHYGADEVLLATHEYDGNGNKTALIDAEGNRTEYGYDGADRQTTVTEGTGSAVAATTATTYDQVNNVLTIKDGRNHGGAFDVRYTYDARYRKISATNGEGQTTTYAYDANNNVVRLTEPRGSAFSTAYRYDELNQLLAVDDTPRANGTTAAGVTRYFYDGNRNKIAQQDANGNLTTYRYDALNRLTDTFQHTVAGLLTSTTARGPSPISNPAGDSESTALHWSYAYDLNSNQHAIVDAKGQRVEKAYDYLGRLVTKTYGGHEDPTLDFQMQSIAYGYDGNGNATSITETKRVAGTNLTESTTQTFDPLDRLQVKIHRDFDDSAGKQIQYDYDVRGNRTRLVDSDGMVTTYAYDARNRLSTATTEAGVTTYTYWEDSLIRRVEYPNGSISDHSASDSYDRADRQVRVVNRPAAAAQPAFSSYEYTYDSNGNRLSQVETQRDLNAGAPETTTYAYDHLNRLFSVTYGPATTPVGAVAYTYEPNGNRRTEQGTDPHTGQPIDRTYRYEELSGLAGVTFNRVNALTQIVDNVDPGGTVAYEYDRNLNQVAKDKAGVRTTYRFGIRDEMLAAGETATPIAFDYDHQGMRIKKTSGGVGGQTRYLYDDRSVLLEYGSTAASLETFHKYDYGYDLLSLTSIDQATGSRDSQFFLTDGLRSTANLTNEAGSLFHSYRYDAWGRVRDQVGASDNPRQYTGHYTDQETGLHYFGARYYDDETGRFLSQDPYLGQAALPPSLHRYLYAYANPLRFVDLTGYESSEANPVGFSGASLGGQTIYQGGGDTAVSTAQSTFVQPWSYRVEEWSNEENQALAKEGTRILGEASSAWRAGLQRARDEAEQRRQRWAKIQEDINAPLIDPTADTGYGWGGTQARNWERGAEKTGLALDAWVNTSNKFQVRYWLKSFSASALKASMAVGGAFVDVLKIGEGAAEGGIGGVAADVGRAALVLDVGAALGKRATSLAAVRGVGKTETAAGTGAGALSDVVEGSATKMGIERLRTPLEKSMFDLSGRLGREIGFAELEVPGISGPVRRFAVGEARNFEMRSLWERPFRVLEDVSIQRPGGTWEVIGQMESEIPLSVKNVKSLLHTHPISGQAAFSAGDIRGMRYLAKQRRDIIFGAVGERSTIASMAGHASPIEIDRAIGRFRDFSRFSK